MEEFQSGFWSHHSTETALTKILSDIRVNYDKNKLSILIFLDISTAFDTIDHGILISHLEKVVDLSDCVLNWFKAYIRGRKLYIMKATSLKNMRAMEFHREAALVHYCFHYTCCHLVTSSESASVFPQLP